MPFKLKTNPEEEVVLISTTDRKGNKDYVFIRNDKDNSQRWYRRVDANIMDKVLELFGDSNYSKKKTKVVKQMKQLMAHQQYNLLAF